jgi:hypothetical protein
MTLARPANARLGLGDAGLKLGNLPGPELVCEMSGRQLAVQQSAILVR